ncbi:MULTISPECIES: S1C family serine protease [Thiorhodovibrio]|uniref:S1C family serine protease n=1 Tax=Thiorhodovibrio TaxID=61593 RepID=UPI001911BFE7|nr:MULTISPECIES: trypsin-like peptidase domain-containing protein [Thiorhodovibrio]MBK5970003.1 2-alkenal reductase [Thiorhodovibrio winogradskyi]WPL12925.1 Putative serine protease HtrA [Thiorhodovibrio litoralis]
MHGFSLSRGLFWAVIAFLLFLAGRPWLEHWLIGLNAEPRVVTARGDLAADELATIEIFERVSQSVVYISTISEVALPWTRNLAEVRRGTGSGFVWDDQGHVVTNFHVIAGASRAQVRLADQRTYAANLIGASQEHDLAVLRIEVPIAGPRAVTIGASKDLRVGQKVFAIGNPFGLDYSLTTGVVSALDRTIVSEDGTEIRRLIQTDAAINPGNSGGPLIDSAGRLIGVNTAIFSPTGGFSGIGFSVPVDTVNRVVPQLIAYGRYIRPRLGIFADDDASRAVLKELGVSGVLILRVESGSPADRAGLRTTRLTAGGGVIPGDIIQSVNGREVEGMGDLIEILEDFQIGDQVRLRIWRNGQVAELTVTLGGQLPQLD